MDNATQSIQNRQGARLLQMQEGEREKVQVHEGWSGLHITLCLRWGVLSS